MLAAPTRLQPSEAGDFLDGSTTDADETAISVKSSGGAVVVDVDRPDSELTGVSIVPVDIGTGVLGCVVGATCEPFMSVRVTRSRPPTSQLDQQMREFTTQTTV